MWRKHRLQHTIFLVCLLAGIVVGSANGQSDRSQEPIGVGSKIEDLELSSDASEVDNLRTDNEDSLEMGSVDPEARVQDTRVPQANGSLQSVEIPETPFEQNAAFQAGLYTGSATYHYLFTVPPATNGLAPQLGISYGSGGARGRAGIVGLGWSLSTGYIMRDAEYTPNSTVDDTFQLLLNGQSHDLIFHNGSYHTEIESYLDIEFVTSGASNTYGGYWIVRDKSGTSYRFGYNDNAENDCVGRTYAGNWYLDEVTDTNGNHIYYSYAGTVSTNDVGTIYPSKIEYNNDKTRVIEFVYENTDRFDKPLVYEQGCQIRYARRLNAVQIKVNDILIRQYIFDYDNQTTALKSQLTSIVEEGSDGSLLPSTVFTYENENRSWNDSPSIWAPVETPFLDDPDPNDDLDSNVEMHDVNRDGLVDIVEGDEEWDVYLNTGSSWPGSGVRWLNENNNRLGERDTVMADINGDGLIDIVEGEGTTFKVNFNNGNGWGGQTSLPAGSDHNLEEPDTQLVDVNGDNLPDIVEGDGSTWTVNFNNGNGWNSPTNWSAGSTHNLGEDDTVLVDVNGDGLVDIVEGDITWTVNLNSGSGWNAPQVWLNQANHHLDEYDTNFADVNGDGWVDIIEGDGASGWDVNLNTGSSWANPVSWLSGGPDFDGEVAVADANGDGYPDIVNREGGIGWQVWSNRGNHSNLLVAIQNSSGGTVAIDYQKTTQFDNSGADSISDLGFNTWVIESVTQDNGTSGSHSVVENRTYMYQDGLHDYGDKEYRGFGKVTEIDSEGTAITYFFHQDDVLKGREYRTETRDASDDLYAKSEKIFSYVVQGTGYIVELDRTEQYSYDGVATNPKVVAVEYEYDVYGNVTRMAYLGEDAQSGDERYEYTEYTYTPSLWIVNKPNHTYLHASDDSTRVRESWFYYDGSEVLDAAPIIGNLTKQEDWLDTGANPIATFTYDSYGNQISITDPNNHTTTYVYGLTDATFTFPEKMINPLLQETTNTYDLTTGNLLSQIDPNGYVASYEYDSFGRLIKEILPYDSSEFPTRSYTYLVNGIAPEGMIVSQRTASGQVETLDSYTFADGFGREIQVRISAENPTQQIVTNTYYDDRGLISEVSVPHLADIASDYADPVAGIRSVKTTYDPVGRETEIENPDNTSRTIVYDHWRVDYFDENGHQISHHHDAFENIIQVDEHNQGEMYTTAYAYSPADELLTITDHDGNVFVWTFDSLGRQTQLDDPDLGTWSYAYDAVGNPTSQTDNRGVTVATQYDELNRPTLVDYPTQSDVTYVYDLNTIGTLSSITDNAGFLTYVYDERLRPVEETRELDGLTWTTLTAYDAADRVISMTYPSGEVVTYTFNAQGQIESVSDLMTNYDYDAFNRITRKEFANGVMTDFTYNLADFRLQSIVTPGLQDLAYTYDAVGNVMSIANNRYGTMETYSYDDLDRLVSAEEPGAYSFDYSYNPVGNLMTVTTETSYSQYTYGEGAGPHAVTSIITTQTPIPEEPIDSAATNSTAPTFTWIIEDDAILSQIQLDDDAAFGSPEFDVETNETNYTPSNMLADGIYYWRVRAGYGNDLWSFWSTPLELTIDTIAPTFTSALINDGEEITYNSNVTVTIIDADDELSGLESICLSLDQENWACQAYTPSIAYQLVPTNAVQTLFVYLKDRAGNVSDIQSDDIELILYPEQPTSSNYQLCAQVMPSIAGTSSSENYQMRSVGGENGGSLMSSTNYTLRSGFVGRSQGCALELLTDRVQAAAIQGGSAVGSRVYVIDEDGLAVAEADVAIEWTLPDSSTVTDTLPTNSLGRAQFLASDAGPGTYTITVQSLSKAGYVYLGRGPTEASATRSSQDLIVTNIQIVVLSGGTSVGTRIFVEDDMGGPIQGALVEVEWTLPDTSIVPASASTNTSGRAQILAPDGGPGLYVVTVTNVTKAGYTWTGGDVITKSIVRPNHPVPFISAEEAWE